MATFKALEDLRERVRNAHIRAMEPGENSAQVARDFYTELLSELSGPQWRTMAGEQSAEAAHIEAQMEAPGMLFGTHTFEAAMLAIDAAEQL